MSKRTNNRSPDTESIIKNEEPKIKYNNDIRDIRSMKQLEKVNLDCESPRLKQAMVDLGVHEEEMQIKDRSDFDKKGLDPEVIDLRFRHFQGRLIDTINRVIEQRRQIKINQARLQNRQFGASMGKTQKSPNQAQIMSQMIVQVGQQMNRKESVLDGWNTQQGSQRNLNLNKAAFLSPSNAGIKNRHGSVLPTIKQGNENTGGGGFFLTDLAERPTMVKSPQVQSSKMFQGMSSIQQSNNPLPIHDFSQISYENRSAIPFEFMVQQEKNFGLAKSQRSKSIIALGYQDKKYRQQLSKKLEKKLDSAIKEKQKIEKMSKIKIKKHMERSEAVKSKRDIELKMETRDTLNLIRETRRKDKLEEQRMADFKAEEQRKINEKLEIIKQKRDRAAKFKEEENKFLDEKVGIQIQQYEENMRSVSKNRNELSSKKINQLSSRNLHAEQIHTQMVKKSIEDNQNIYTNFEKEEQKEKKRFEQKIFKMSKEKKAWLEERQETQAMLSNRQADGEGARKEKAWEMMAKLKRSQKAVEQFQAEQAHKQLLATEQRKLQDDDMKKTHERAKRLALRKKMEIIGKEEKDKQMFVEVRKREQKLVEFRYKNRVSSIIQSERYDKTLDTWSKKGFANTSLDQDMQEVFSVLDERKKKLAGGLDKPQIKDSYIHQIFQNEQMIKERLDEQEALENVVVKKVYKKRRNREINNGITM